MESPQTTDQEDLVVKTVKLPFALAREVDAQVVAEDLDFAKFCRRALRNELAAIEQREVAMATKPIHPGTVNVAVNMPLERSGQP